MGRHSVFGYIVVTYFRVMFVPSFLLDKEISLERLGPLLQPFHVGPSYFPPHLLTKGEDKTILFEFTERILHYPVKCI